MPSSPWPTLYTSAIPAERKERVSSQILQHMLGIGVHWPVWAMWALLDLGVQRGWLPLSHVDWEGEWFTQGKSGSSTQRRGGSPCSTALEGSVHLQQGRGVLDRPGVFFVCFIYLFIYGCVGSSFLCEGFL